MASGDDDLSRDNPEHDRPLIKGRLSLVPGGGSTPIPKVSRSAQDHIGAALRGMYGELLAEPVPDAFTDLIRRLSEEASG